MASRRFRNVGPVANRRGRLIVGLWVMTVAQAVVAAAGGPSPSAAEAARPRDRSAHTDVAANANSHRKLPARQRMRRMPVSNEAATTASIATPNGFPVPDSQTQSPPHVRAARGGPTSVQVNVNGQGLDVIGDAANEPSMAIDPTDPRRIVIGWRQFDTITSGFRQAGVAYSTDGGATWTSPGVIEPGVFRSDPVLDVSSSGVFYYSSLTSDGENFDVSVFRSLSGGVTWLPGVYAFGGDKQWLSVDRTGGMGHGHVYQHWSFSASCCFPTDFTRSIDGGASFQLPLSLPPPPMRFGTTTVGPDGTLYVAGADYGSNGQLVARSQDARNAATTPSFDLVKGVDLGGYTAFAGVNPIGLLGQVWIAADHSAGSTRGTLYVLASVADALSPNPVDVRVARSVDGGRSWSRAVQVNDDPMSGAWHWFGAISVAPNGRIDATWLDTRNDPVNPADPLLSEVFFSYSMDQGRTWTPGIAVSPPFNHYLGYPSGSEKLGDYTHMISDNGGANLAYAATFAGGQNVYFLRIPMDCNQNGIEDPLDILNQQSGDCNGNDVPDECEPNIDCNENRVPDICDIGAGTSDDCNGNRVPDSCEAPADCNGNQILDICDLASGRSRDCNANGIPDECDVASGQSADRNANGVPDECQGACCFCDSSCVETERLACQLADGFPRGPGSICADAACELAPSNDQCPSAVVLGGQLGQYVAVDNRCASVEDGDFATLCGEDVQPFTGDLWYDFTSPCDGRLEVSLCQTGDFDSILAVTHFDDGCVCRPASIFDPLVCGDDTCGVPGGPSRVGVDVRADECYQIRIGGWGGAVGTAEMSVLLWPVPGGASPRTLPFLPDRPLGDCNSDGHLRRSDQRGFLECLSGPAVGASICCKCADLDDDSVVTLRDFASVQRMLEPDAP